ncbi:MAG: EAL domain-containing protein [Proteobacteria bacterium]|nr:EAL domain-containing protein [Pseudomonadota bacterium]
MKTWKLLTLVGGILLILLLLIAGGQPVGENVLEPGFDDNYVMETLRERWEDIVLATSIAGVIAIFLALRLVAERTRNEKALRESEERFRAVVDNSPTQIHIKDLEGRYILINREAEKLFGITDKEGRGKTSYDIFPKKMADSFTAHDRAVLETQQAIEEEEEFLLEEGVHTYLTVKFPIRDAAGDIAAIGAVGTDITKRKRAEAAHIEYLALHDSLTDLPNRFLFHDRLETAVAQSVRSGNMLGLLFLDLDDFKDVNDTLGHDAGDALLKAVAERLKSYLRESDTVGRHNTTLARIGGDEFTILLTNMAEPAGAATVAERIIDELSRPFSISGQEIQIGVCIGISIYPSHGSMAEDLLKKADLALYRSKAEGRNRYHFYSEEMETEIRARKDLERGLHKALAEDQFSLVYQPQMDTHSGAMVGMEALLRWDHPERGPISPVEFIPVAEATGAIVPIGEWVLRQACAQNKAWRDAGLPPFSVAVNLSAVQFRQDDLVATVDAAVRDAGLDPADLHLEITESVFMQERGREMLLDFRRRGIRISLDDFGTGYSSLSYLTRFPIDKIKLDRSFVRDIAHDTSSAAIIKAVVNLGHSLSMRVNVEGVETLEEMGILKSYGVDEIQGFYYSRPLSADAVPEFVAANIASSKHAAKSA